MERKKSTIRFGTNASKGCRVTSPNCMDFSPLSVNTTGNIFGNGNAVSNHSGSSFHSGANSNVNINNGFPWLHGENGMFPSPCSSTTTSSTLHDASGAPSSIVAASSGITGYNANNLLHSGSNVFSDVAGNDLQTSPTLGSNKVC